MSLNFFLKLLHGKKKKKPLWQIQEDENWGNDLQLILQRASSNKPLPQPDKEWAKARYR